MKTDNFEIANLPTQINCVSFDELEIYGLYDIMNLRQAIFIVEQDCPYLDADYVDLKSHHVTFYIDQNLVSYVRIVPPGISYDGYSSIGRVVTHQDFRNKGVGKVIMEYAISKTKELHPDQKIKISAQKYITKFYTQLGFKIVGEEYLEDDIPHIAMIYDGSDGK